MRCKVGTVVGTVLPADLNQFLFGKHEEIPNDWEIATLSSVVKKDKFAIVDGPFGTQLHSYEYVKDGVPGTHKTTGTTGTTVNLTPKEPVEAKTADIPF